MKTALLEGAVFLLSYAPGSDLDSESHVYYKLSQVYATLLLHSAEINTEGMSHDEQFRAAVKALAAAKQVTPDGVKGLEDFLYDYRRALRENNLPKTVQMLAKYANDLQFAAHLSLEDQQKVVKLIEGFQEMNKGVST